MTGTKTQFDDLLRDVKGLKLKGVTSPDVVYPQAEAQPAGFHYSNPDAYAHAPKDAGEHAEVKAAQFRAAQEIKAMIDEARSNNNPELANQLAGLLSRLSGAKDPRAIDAVLDTAQTYAAGAGNTSPNQQLTPQQKAEKLWGEIKENNKKISANLEDLHKDKYISDEEYDKLKKERERLDKLDINDPERLKAEKIYNDRVQKIAEEAQKKAEGHGDDGNADKAKQTVGITEEQRKIFASVQETLEQKKEISLAHDGSQKERFPVQNVSENAAHNAPKVAAESAIEKF